MKNNAAISYFGLSTEIDSFEKIKDKILINKKIEYVPADQRSLKRINLSPEDLRLRMESEWQEDTVMFKQIINTVDEGELQVEVLLATAVVPKPSRNVWKNKRTDLLSHDKNVKKEYIQVVFFKMENRFYYTVWTQNYKTLERINENLIGDNFVQTHPIKDLRLFS